MPSDQTIDERVATILGFPIDGHHRPYRQDGACSLFFFPSSTPADALLAAESYGLFDEERHGCELHRYGNAWHVVGYREPLASGTFCEVVCESIKRLEEMGAAAEKGM